MSNRRSTAAAFLAAAALIVAVVATDVWPSSEEASPATTVAHSDVEVMLTVDTVSVDCPTLVESFNKGDGELHTIKTEDGQTVVKFKVGALLPVGMAGRAWSDALSSPVLSQQPADALKEIQAAICQDPLMGVTVAHMFAHLEVEGIKVVELNDWLKPYGVDDGQINDLAAGFVPLLDVKAPTSEQLTAAISQNLVYQKMAEKLGTLLTRFGVAGIQAEQSTLNYHLDAGGLVVGKLPEVAINAKQESLPALVLDLTAKPGICLVRIGFNAGDKRPEVFGCPPVNPPTTVSTGGSTTTPPPTTVGGKDATKRPPQDPVVSCPPGQFADRNSGACTSLSATTTTTYNNSEGDSGPGAPGPGVSVPATDPAPDPTVPTNTGSGDGTLPDPGV